MNTSKLNAENDLDMVRQMNSRDCPSGRKTERYSPARLLKQRLELPGDVSVSVEKLNGRLMVRIDQPARPDPQ
jgi:hypothetical protein